MEVIEKILDTFLLNQCQYQNYYLYRKFFQMDMWKVMNENEEFVRDHLLMHYYFHQMRMVELFLVLMEVQFQLLLVTHSKYKELLLMMTKKKTRKDLLLEMCVFVHSISPFLLVLFYYQLKVQFDHQ